MDELMDCLFEVDDMPLECSSTDITLPNTQDTTLSHNEDLPHLNCFGRRGTGVELFSNMSSDGLVGRGMLKWLLDNKDPFPGLFKESVTSLCGHMTVTCQAITDNAAMNFFCFRKQINIVFEQLTSPMETDEYTNAVEHCIKFLHFIDSQISRLTSNKPHPLITRTLDDIVTHLTNTITSLESLDDIIGMYNEDHTESVIHLILHLYWTLISLLYRVSIYDNTSTKYVTTFLESCDLLIRTLLSEAAARFNQSFSLHHRKVPGLYRCPCFMEVWLLISRGVDKIAEFHNTNNFWEMISRIVSELSEDQPSSITPTEYPVSPQEPYCFSWWIISQFTGLYGYAIDGKLNGKQENSTVGNWKMVQVLLAKSFKQQSVNPHFESHLRWYMSCCLYIYETWLPPSVLPIVIGWDYYHKHLNDSFHLSSVGVDELLTLDRLTCREWYDHIITLCGSRLNDYNSFFVEGTSFELFLRILACCLRDGCHGNQFWRQMKSRFYSKFSQRRVLELTSKGLSHLISLFLVLSNTSDTNETGQQLYSFLSYRKMVSTSEKNLKLLWKGVFVLLLMYQGKSVPIPEPLILKITSNLSILCKELVSSSHDTHTLLSDVISMILDGLQELIEMGVGVVSGAEHLFGSYIGELFGVNFDSSFNMVLNFVSNIFMSLSSQFQELCKPSSVAMETDDTYKVERLRSFSNTLWSQCCPGILKRVDDSCLPLLASTASIMTEFSCEWMSSQTAASRLLNKIGFAETTHPTVVCPFLSHIITNDTTHTKLLDEEKTQLDICHSWLRSILLSGQPQSIYLQELTRVLPKIEFVGSLINMSDVEVTDSITLLHQILKGIATRHSSAYSVQEKLSWREKLSTILGGDFCRYLDPALSGTTSLKTCYRVSVALVRHCSTLIYSKTSTRCLLPQILDALILPVSSSRRPSPQGMSYLIKGHLHHFLQGLFNLEPQRDEFVNRKIKQIFSRYFHSYLQPPSLLMGTSPNPFMLLFAPVFTDTPSSDACNLLLSSINIIIAQELTFPQSSSALFLSVQFIHQVLRKLNSYQLLLRCTPLLLGRVLSCVLFCQKASDSTQLQKESITCIQLLLENSNNHQDLLPCSELLPVIRDYLIINLPDYKGYVFKPLVAIATYHPSLMKLVAVISLDIISDYEHKKGSGVDHYLRTAYEELKNKLK